MPISSNILILCLLPMMKFFSNWIRISSFLFFLSFLFSSNSLFFYFSSRSDRKYCRITSVPVATTGSHLRARSARDCVTRPRRPASATVLRLGGDLFVSMRNRVHSSLSHSSANPTRLTRFISKWANVLEVVQRVQSLVQSAVT